MEFITPNKITKARKDCTCDFCGITIPKCSKYLSQVNKYDGVIYRWKSHEKCTQLAEALKMYDNCDEGLTQATFIDLVNESYAELNIESETKVFFKEKLEILFNKYLTK